MLHPAHIYLSHTLPPRNPHSMYGGKGQRSSMERSNKVTTVVGIITQSPSTVMLGMQGPSVRAIRENVLGDQRASRAMGLLG